MESLAIQSILKKPDEEPDLVTNQKLVTDRGRNVVGEGGGRRGRAQGGGGQGSSKGGGWEGGGGPEYANTSRNGGKGGWEGEDRSMQIPREMGGRGVGKGRTGVCKYPEDGSM